MNGKTKTTKNQVNSIISLQEREELVRKANKILDELKSSTWRDLEVGGKFTKNDKLSFISDDMLIVGCDIGSETHYARAIDTRGRELSRKVLEFNNDTEGVQKAKDWSVSWRLCMERSRMYWALSLPDITGRHLQISC